MLKHLYFVCPSDHLEPIINGRFRDRHYFLSSLGNSIVFDQGVADEVKQLILRHDITEITFVLAENNAFATSSFQSHQLMNVSGLSEVQANFSKQRRLVEEFWQTDDHQSLTISYYLNLKINELQQRLDFSGTPVHKITGKIYSRKAQEFEDIHSNLVCLDSFKMN